MHVTFGKRNKLHVIKGCKMEQGDNQGRMETVHHPGLNFKD